MSNARRAQWEYEQRRLRQARVRQFELKQVRPKIGTAKEELQELRDTLRQQRKTVPTKACVTMKVVRPTRNDKQPWGEWKFPPLVFYSDSDPYIRFRPIKEVVFPPGVNVILVPCEACNTGYRHNVAAYGIWIVRIAQERGVPIQMCSHANALTAHNPDAAFGGCD